MIKLGHVFRPTVQKKKLRNPAHPPSPMKICRFFLQFFFEILPKFIDFVNSDDCIEKIIQKSIDYNQFLFENRFEVIKKQIFFLVKNEKFR